jgi:hypothetical protein
MQLIQEVLSVQRVPLGGLESGITNDAAEFLFGCAVGHADGASDVFFSHH